MNTFIALLRGVNVGGNTILPMRDLVDVLEGLGLKKVKTYIQSGNVVFQSAPANATDLSRKISAAIEKARGLSPQVLLLGIKELQAAIARNPFPQGVHEPKSLHLFFLDSIPRKPDLETLETIKTKSEQFKLINQVFYLYAPDGIGRSKLAAKVEKALGVAVTARNWRTVSEVMSIATAVADDA
ncbi:MAG: DUF1697 domain-containing protein [Chloroflexi bacterium]|nr:DUF1697 domain-containing protein [Chloroflexota bacterium]